MFNPVSFVRKKVSAYTTPGSKFVSICLTSLLLFVSYSPLLTEVAYAQSEDSDSEIESVDISEAEAVDGVEDTDAVEPAEEESNSENEELIIGKSNELEKNNENEGNGEILSTAIEGNKVTFGSVLAGTVYTYPKNESVKLTFTSLPEGDYYLSIEEIETAYGVGYEFLSDLEDGIFEYDLRLPNTIGSSNIEVQYSEDGVKYNEVDESLTVNDNEVVLYGVNHFTIYVITDDYSDFSEGNTVASIAAPAAITPDAAGDPPIITSFNDPATYNASPNSLSVRATAVDTDEAVHEITYEILDDLGNPTSVSGVLNNYAATIDGVVYGLYDVDSAVYGYSPVNITSLNNGNYQVRICATDTAGNSGSVEGGLDELPVECLVYDVLIDRTAPVVEEVPDMAFFEGDEFPELSVGIEDEGEGLHICFYVYHTADPETPWHPELGGTGMNCIGYVDPISAPYEFSINSLVDELVGFEGIDVVDTSVFYEGTYTFWLRALDLSGNSYQQEFTIEIVNVEPEVEFSIAGSSDPSQITIENGSSVTFEGSFIDPSFIDSDEDGYSNNLAEYADDQNWWPIIDYGDGDVDILIGGMYAPGNLPAIPAHQYNDVGVYTVSLFVCEDHPLLHLDPELDPEEIGFNFLSEAVCTEVTVTVNVVDSEPSVDISASPSTHVSNGVTVVLTANYSGVDAPVTVQGWNGNFTGCSGTGNTVTVPSSAGTYTCSVTVIDSDGDVATDTITITVDPAPTNNNDDNDDAANNTGNTSTGTGNGGQVLGTTTTTTGNEDTVSEEDEADDTEEENREVLGLDCESESKVSGYVYYDENDNGKKDSDEDGEKEVTVKLYAEIDGERKLISSTQTDKNGYWQTEVCPGTYEVEIDKDDLPSRADVKGDSKFEITVDKDIELNDVNFTLEKSGLFGWWSWWYCLICLVLLAVLGGAYYYADRRRQEA